MTDKLLLASSSPRRRELLEQLGLPFAIVRADFEEIRAEDCLWLSPHEHALYNAGGKARAAQRENPHRPILAADTVVALGSRIFGKPADVAQARDYLRLLSGHTHHVLTALVLLVPPVKSGTAKNEKVCAVTSTRVTFLKLSEARIRRYLSTVSVLDKAGAYAVQEHSDWIIEKIEGSLSNVIGLPVETVSALLKPYLLSAEKSRTGV